MSYDIGPKIGIEGEKAFKSAISDINNNMKVLSSEMKRCASEFDGNANSMNALKSKSEILNKQYVEQKDKVEALQKALENAKNTYGESSNQVKNWQIKLNDAESYLNKLNTQISKNDTYMNEAKNSTSKAASSINEFGKEIKEAGDKTSVFGDVLKANVIGNAITDGIRELGTVLKDTVVDSIKLASDLTESQNVVDTVFKDSSESVSEWSKSLAGSYGISELSGKKYVGTLGAMLSSMGLTNDKTLEMSESMVQLAGDMASFYNLSTDEAFEKIRSGISGETEPLKQLGINLSVANLEAFGLSEGITKAYNAMSQSEQSTLRYNYLMNVTANAQGDFAKTSNSYANQQRILALQFENLETKIGKQVVPALTSSFTKLNKKFDESGDKIADYVGGALEGLADGLIFIVDNSDEVISAVGGIAVGMAVFKVGGAIQSGITMATSAWKAYKEATVAATTAQAALNLVTSSSVLGFAALAIGGIAAGLLLYEQNAEKSTVATEDLSLKIKNSTKELADMNAEIAKNTKERTDNTAKIEGEYGASKELANQLYNLADKESLSNSEKATMGALVEDLNDSIPDLNLTIDKQTGLLSLQRDEVDKLVDSNLKLQEAEAAKTDLKSIATDKYNAEKKLAEKQTERQQAVEKLSKLEKEYAVNLEKSKTAVDDAEIGTDQYTQANSALNLEMTGLKKTINGFDTEVDATQTTINDLGTDWQNTAKLVGDYTSITGTTNAVDLLGNKIKTTSSESTTAIQGLIDKYNESLDSATEKIYGSMDLFDKFAIDTSISSQTLLDNLSSQITGMSQWADNMKSLAKRGVVDGLLKELYEMGPTAASQIAALNAMSDTQLQQYVTMWQDKSKLASQAAKDELSGLRDTTQNQITQMTATVEDTISTSGTTSAQGFGNNFAGQFGTVIQNLKAQFNSAGVNSAQGFDEGFHSQVAGLVADVSAGFGRVVANVKDVLGIHSPSKVFAEMGGYSAEGYGNGFGLGMVDVNKEIANTLPTDIELGKIKGSYSTSINSDSISNDSKANLDNNETKLSELIRTISDRPVNLFIDGKKFAYATAQDMSNELAVLSNSGLRKVGVRR